jgi:hypothetical protein
MKKSFLLILFFCLSFIFVNAQGRYGARYRTTYKAYSGDRFELIGGIGATNFLGDLGGANDIGTNFLADFDIESVRPAVNVGVRYFYTGFLAQKGMLSFGYVAGSDANTLNPARRNRNLSFFSPLFEFGTTFELYFLPDKKESNLSRSRGLRAIKSRPVLGYISSGINGFYFDPMALDANGNAQRLQPLNTEGQGVVATRSPYNLVDFNIPINLGFIFRINPAMSINVELGYRKTFTDYMDDVSMTYVDPTVFTNTMSSYFADPSLATLDPTNPYAIPGASNPGQQRGDPRDKDSYVVMFVNFTYKISYFGRSIPKYY